MKNSNVNINLYKTFLEVYELKNISKTAKKMYISQSAVSQNIKSLENQLGVTLFKKSTKGIFPTNVATCFMKMLKRHLIFYLIVRIKLISTKENT